MRKTAKLISTATSAVILLGCLTLAPATSVVAASAVEDGKKLAFNRKKGNCLACHAIKGGKLAGNIGPPLISMKARFPDKAKMRAQIWDSTRSNPNTMMPPFGRHKILSESDINKITEYIYTL
ncbi:MAG: sulfur oxidation c-type cytochrome SoxX [Gammaproteobacteria bacterium]|nr:sulfur oxidation c-type cytochrome SoxX [Gammaproteobacteria bacterium]